MARKDIFKILEEKYDIEKEFKIVIGLFFHPTLKLHTNQQVSIEVALDKAYFYAWKQRGCCINSEDMRNRLGLDTFILEEGVECDLEFKIQYLEYICNLINLSNTKLSYPDFQKTKEYLILEQNVDILLSHLNYEKVIFKEEEKVILVPKDPAATAVAEISSKDVAFAILKYHHASLKGQVEEKRKLLRSIANEYEPLLNKPIDGFKEYFDKATNMLNNMNIRHNNKSGKYKKELVAQMSDEELESWYDELYQLLLFCVLIKDNKERKDKVDDLLKRINPKPEKQ